MERSRTAMCKTLKKLCHSDFKVFGSKLPQIITKCLCRTQNAYRTLRGRYQVNSQRENKPPEPPVQDSTSLKNCNFRNHANIALTISCHHSQESPSNQDTQ